MLPNNGDVCRSRRHTSTEGLLLLAWDCWVRQLFCSYTPGYNKAFD